MSSKWKYASIDAETRLKMLREGNSELFDEEVERTRSITKAKRELGLDTTEQENWMDTIGYNYNLWNAKNAGESPESVSKTRYASLYLDEKKTKKENTANTSLKEFEKIGKAKEAARNAVDKRYKDFKSELSKEFERQYGIFEEAIVNSGASLSGGKAEMLREALRSEFEKSYDELDREKFEEIEKTLQKYADLENTLRSYQKKGAKAKELTSIANALINDAAKNDGYDANEIIRRSYGKAEASVKNEALTNATDNADISEIGAKNKNKASIPEEIRSNADDSAKKLFGLTQDAIKRILENLGFDKDSLEELVNKLSDYISKTSGNKK